MKAPAPQWQQESALEASQFGFREATFSLAERFAFGKNATRVAAAAPSGRRLKHVER